MKIYTHFGSFPVYISYTPENLQAQCARHARQLTLLRASILLSSVLPSVYFYWSISHICVDDMCSHLLTALSFVWICLTVMAFDSLKRLSDFNHTIASNGLQKLFLRPHFSQSKIPATAWIQTHSDHFLLFPSLRTQVIKQKGLNLASIVELVENLQRRHLFYRGIAHPLTHIFLFLEMFIGIHSLDCLEIEKFTFSIFLFTVMLSIYQLSRDFYDYHYFQIRLLEDLRFALLTTRLRFYELVCMPSDDTKSVMVLRAL